MEKNSKPICYGSFITLKNLDNFYLSCQGFIDNSPYLVKQIHLNFSCGLFRIIPASTYAIQNEILDFTQDMQKDDFLRKVEKFDRLDKLEDSLEGEIKTNLQSYSLLKGKPIRYGSLVQFEHVLSRKVLMLDSNENSEIEKENLKVSLADFSSSLTHFRVLPGYIYQKFSDGIVKSLDKVLLEVTLLEERKSAYLHSSKNSSNEVMMNGIYSILIQDEKKENDYLEVNVSLEQKTKWVITEFAMVTDEEKHLICGDYIWMVKPEENACMSVGKNRESKGRNLVFSQSNNDTNGLWMVENEDPGVGGPVELGVAYRLRHISSGLYLAVDSEMAPCLVKGMALGTLWRFVPLEPENGFVRTSEICFIFNEATQRKLSVSEEGLQVMTEKYLKRQTESSVFKVAKGGGEVIWETFFLIHCYPILRGFERFINYNVILVGPDAFKMLYEFRKQSELIEMCISKLIQFCNNKLKGMIGIDNHYGEVQSIRQKMLKEQNFFEVLVNILNLAFKEPIDPQTVIKAVEKKGKAKFEKKIIDLENIRLRHVAKIVSGIYELLSALCKKNSENQVYSYKFFPIFVKHIGLNLGAKEFISSVLVHNEQLIFSISSTQQMDRETDMIRYFFSLLQDPFRPARMTLIDLLKSICVYKGQGVTSNQQKILKYLLMYKEQLKSVLPQTICHKGKLCIFIESKKLPIDSCFESGIIYSFNDDIIYLTKLLELYANMSVGRNFEVSSELLPEFPFEIIHSLMWNSQLTDELRAVFCKLLLNLYIDCFPKEEAAKPYLIKEFYSVDLVKNSMVPRENSPNENATKIDYKNSEKFVGSILFCDTKENIIENSALNDEDSNAFNLISNIFDYVKCRNLASLFDCELLRLTSKLIKFELLGMKFTDFEKRKKVQHPVFPIHELDIIKILKNLVPHLATSARKTTNHSFLRKKRSVKVDPIQKKKDEKVVYLSNLLQDTSNVNDPVIRSAANIKNFITSFKQTSLSEIEAKSIESRIKLKICRMLHYYLNCRQDFLLNNVVAWFTSPANDLRQKLENSDKQNLNNLDIKNRLLKVLPPVMKFTDNAKVQDFLRQSQEAFTCMKGPFVPDLNYLYEDPILVLLLKSFTFTENYKVQSSLFQLIARCYEQRKELLRNLYKFFPVSGQTEIDLFYWVKTATKQLKSYTERCEIWLGYWQNDKKTQKENFEIFKNTMKLLKNLDEALFEARSETDSLRIENRESVSQFRQKMMNYLNVDQLVLVLIKKGIHELISIYSSEGNSKHLKNLTNLFEICFSFLTNFVKKNPENQKRLYKSLHIFLQYLNIPLGQIELICEIFRDNLKLIKKIDEKFLEIFKNLILNYGRRAMFLEILKVIQVVNGKAVPSIQRIVINIFVPEELDAQLLYMEDKNSRMFSFESELRENIEYFDEPFEYHASLLEVLAKCGFGLTGMYFNEAKCQNILPIPNIFDILITAEQDPRYQELRTPMLEFFYNIYLDCKAINMELKNCEKFSEYIYLQSEQLAALESPDKTFKDFLRIFLKILLKYRNFYIKKQLGVLFFDSQEIKSLQSFVISLKENYFKIQDLIQDSDILNLIKALSQAVDIELGNPEGENEILISSPESYLKLSAKESSYSDLALKSWSRFIDLIIFTSKLKEVIEEEEQALVIAINHISLLDNDLSFEKVVKSIVNFIRLSKSQQSPVKVTIKAIELLTRILANPSHDKYTKPETAKKSLQNSMTGFGVVRVILGLMSDLDLDSQVFNKLVQVCIELLEGGNQVVQSEIYLFFNNSYNSESFFQKVHFMLMEYIDKFDHEQGAAIKKFKVFKVRQDEIESLLRLLQLFCEGHNLELQEYMRVQTRSRTSYNLISDIILVVELLLEKQALVSFKVMSQCFDTLTEFIQGPCFNNQDAIINGKFLELINKLLGISFLEYLDGFNCDSLAGLSESDVQHEDVLTFEDWMIPHLKYKAMITVLSLMEGRNDKLVTIRLIRSLNIELLKKNLVSIYIDYARVYGPEYYDFDIFDHVKESENYQYGLDQNQSEKLQKSAQLVIENGFMIYHLLKTFMENDDPESQEIISAELQQLQAFFDNEEESFQADRIFRNKSVLDPRNYKPKIIKEAISSYKFSQNSEDYQQIQEFILNATYRFFEIHTGKIEIIFRGDLFRVYFSLPPQFRGLNKDIKEHFQMNVDRDTDQSKLKYLLLKADSIIEQITQEHYLLNAMKNSKIISVIVMKVYVWREIAFCLTIALNLVILLSYSDYHEMDRMNEPCLFNFKYNSIYWNSDVTKKVILILGVVQLFCCVVIVAFFLLKKGPIVAKRGWRSHEPSVQFFRSNPGNLKIAVLRSKQLALTALYVLIDFNVLYHVGYTVFSVLGISTHPFYFSLLLLDIIYKYKNLQNVVKSFIVPSRALLMTFCLMVIFMYIFAIIGYFYFREDYENRCKTLYWCTILIWDASFKSLGAIGGYMYRFKDGDIHAQRFFYDNIFYILLEVIIIGIVEGLIIDTFALLREEHERNANDRETKCFICGLERDFIERKTNDTFFNHTLVDHNEWNYILFLAYLKNKPETEYTGFESYIKDQVTRQEVSWIPNRRAIRIKDISENEQLESLKEIRSLNDRLKNLEDHVTELKVRR